LGAADFWPWGYWGPGEGVGGRGIDQEEKNKRKDHSIDNTNKNTDDPFIPFTLFGFQLCAKLYFLE